MKDDREQDPDGAADNRTGEDVGEIVLVRRDP
jgi:hypothetical protein